jgi:hypothetical protein
VDQALAELGSDTPEEILRRQAAGRFRPMSASDRAQLAREVRAMPNFSRLSEVRPDDAISRRLAAGVLPALRFEGRGGSMEVLVFSTRTPIISCYGDSVLILSTGLLEGLSDDELLAAVSHELAHGWYIEETALARQSRDAERLKVIELKCDAVAVLMMLSLRRDPSALLSALDAVDARLRQLYGADYLARCDSRKHPTLTARRLFYARFLAQIRGAAVKRGAPASR